MESRKMVLKNYRAAMEKQRGEEVEMHGKSNMETYLTI